MGLKIEPKTFEKVFSEITLAADENKKAYLMTAMDFYWSTPPSTRKLFFNYFNKPGVLEAYVKQAFQVLRAESAIPAST